MNMKKIISLALAALLSFNTILVVSADPDPETPVEPGIIEEYQYTSSINSDLSISNNTAKLK